MKSRFSLLVSALCAVGCSGGNSNVTYVKLAPGTASGFSGTDCPGMGPTTTFSGIDGDGTVAIYVEPNAKYFIDLGGGDGLEGTLVGGNYSFTGSWSADIKSNDEIQTQETISVTLNAAGSGFTGTLNIQDQCQSSGNDLCGAGNPLAGAGGGGNPFTGLTGAGVFSTDTHNFNCSSSESLVGVQVSDVEQIATPGGATPSGPAP